MRHIQFITMIVNIIFILLSNANSQTPFTEIDAGLAGVGFTSSVAWGDYDNDGDLDILLTGSSISGNISRVYRNDGGDSFTNIAAGLTGMDIGSAAWCDYDNDGDLDILLTGNYGVSDCILKIYRNDNGSFIDTDLELAGVSNGQMVTGDYDNDGDLDILLTGYTYEYPDYVCSKIYKNDSGSFTEIETNLIDVYRSSVAWGDYDNDGDLDILLTGYVYSTNNHTSKVYQNNGGSFTDIEADLPAVYHGSVSWGDYDNDGDLDILLTGYPNVISKIYRNDGNGSFTDIAANLTGVYHSSVDWGDFDNDGDLDILLTGCTDSENISKVYRNDGNGNFTDINAGLVGVDFGSVCWGDFDNDGDLDILLTGSISPGNYISKVYRNNIGTANTVPTAPTNLTSSVDGGSITLSWDTASDNETPTNGLNYNLRIGKTSGGNEVMSAHADSTSGYRRIVALGNSQKRTSWTIKNLSDGRYYWSVQAIDAAYAGSEWAAEQSFIIQYLPPDPPKNLTAYPGNQQITISWIPNTENDLHKYNIYRDTTSPAETLIDSLVGHPPDTSYVDTGLTNGQVYYYRITAVDNAENESDFSNEVSEIPGKDIFVVFTEGFETYPVGVLADAPESPWVRLSASRVGDVTTTWVHSGEKNFQINSYSTSIEIDYVKFDLDQKPAQLNIELWYTPDGYYVYKDFAEIGLGYVSSTYDMDAIAGFKGSDHDVYFFAIGMEEPVNIYNELEYGIGPANMGIGTPIHNYIKTIFDFQNNKVQFYIGLDSNAPLQSTVDFNGTLDFNALYIAGGLNPTYIDDIYVEARGKYVGIKIYSDISLIPSSYYLAQNYPNPFNQNTSIEFGLPKSEHVTIELINGLGQKIDVLVNSDFAPGKHTVKWNGENYLSGLYFYRLRAGSVVYTKRLLLLK